MLLNMTIHSQLVLCALIKEKILDNKRKLINTNCTGSSINLNCRCTLSKLKLECKWSGRNTIQDAYCLRQLINH